MDYWTSTRTIAAIPAEFIHSAALILGLLIGSFINVVVYRSLLIFSLDEKVSEKINLCYPASHCPSCKHTLKAWQNIPLLSWLILRGRCHYCSIRIPMSYPLVEAMCGLLFFILTFFFVTPLSLLFAFTLCSFLLTLTLIDLKSYLLPDSLTLPLLWIGLLSHTLINGVQLEDAVFGAVAGYLVLWCLYWGFKFVTGREGMGYGDFKLLAALGAWMGWQSLPVICITSSVMGVCIALTGRLAGRTITTIPFGPCLAIAGMISYISQQSPTFWLMFL